MEVEVYILNEEQCLWVEQRYINYNLAQIVIVTIDGNRCLEKYYLDTIPELSDVNNYVIEQQIPVSILIISNN
jgi:hypothetical protein